MKNITLLLLTFTAYTLVAQQGHLNEKKGLFLQGYDVVSYFDGKAEKGNENFEHTYQGVSLYFTSKAHLDQFIQNPSIYMPAYGGYCAYAIATSGDKVKVDPKTYEVRNGRLFLFYNFGKTNTLDSWLNEKPEELILQADKNWGKIIAN